ncbi:LuxR C-terminal-related transcriptional regulator [Nocardia sp. NPDC058058]|uniref:LuxR C-terminal-related transcriptional regulator n=1 Tax=Nocardia sp. NPDC058058 TaxID=3346317 RepID=UPI0036DE5141
MTDSSRAHIARDEFTPIARPELYARLDAAVASPVGHVLRISAPAGSGKTVLITDWLGNRLRHTLPGVHTAQLTLTDHNSAAGEFGRALLECAGARERPTVLVIDDAHRITDPESIALLEEFIDNAPATRTTVLAARHDPPLRWHNSELRGGVSDLRASDLAFSPARVRELCERHGYRATDAELITIMRLTRGWAALVRMAVRHLAAHHDRPTALAELALVPPAIADLFDADILEPLPEHIRHFVTTLSVPASYTAAQAEFVTGTTAQPILDELVRTRFPMRSVAREGDLRFTYHPLLRAYLLAQNRRLGQRTWAELHARTAQWYLSTGQPMSALPHLLQVTEPNALRQFLREHGLRLVLEGNGPGLFRQLEHGRPTLTADPYLRALRTVAALEQRDISRATVHLDLLLRRPTEPGVLAPTSWLTPLSLATSAAIALSTGAGISEFLIPQRIPLTGQPDIDSYTAIQIGTVMMARGDIASGDVQFRRAHALADSTGNPRLTVRADIRRAVVAGLGGAVGRMRSHAEHGIDVASAHDLRDSHDARQATAIAAFAEYLCGETVSATQTRARRALGTELAPGPYTELLERLVAFDEADDKYDAAESLRRALSVLLRRPPLLPAVLGRLVPHVVRVLIEVDATHSARLLIDQCASRLGDTPDIVLARALTHITDRPESARALVDPLLAADLSRHPVSMITAWLVEASARAALRNPPKARAAIATAVHRAAPDHLVRPFLDVPGAGALLDEHSGTFGRDNAFADAVRAHPAIRRPRSLPSLTATELTVLNQLPSGRTAQQIADVLGVSITTVKTHLRGIYAKLGASSRAGALDLAHRSGLL